MECFTHCWIEKEGDRYRRSEGKCGELYSRHQRIFIQGARAHLVLPVRIPLPQFLCPILDIRPHLHLSFCVLDPPIGLIPFVLLTHVSQLSPLGTINLIIKSRVVRFQASRGTKSLVSYQVQFRDVPGNLCTYKKRVIKMLMCKYEVEGKCKDDIKYRSWNTNQLPLNWYWDECPSM